MMDPRYSDFVNRAPRRDVLDVIIEAYPHLRELVPAPILDRLS